MKTGWLWLVVPFWAQAQFVAVESGDEDFARTEVHIHTMDRTLVPLVTETRRRQVSETRTETDTVTQTRLADGTYFASQRRLTITEKVSPTEVRISTAVAETDRQGQTRTRRQVTETVLSTAGGEQRTRVELTRNSSGNLVLARQITETITRQPDGSLRAQRVEHERDVNGKLVPKREVAEQTIERAPNEKVITSRIFSHDHLTGRLAEIGREETIVQSSANTTQSTRLIQQRIGTTWAVKGRVETTEVQTPTGIERETIHYGRSSHGGSSYSSADPLQPRFKIVERTVAGPQGSTRVEREVYRRDVNGEWKPESFRAESPAVAPDADDP